MLIFSFDGLLQCIKENTFRSNLLQSMQNSNALGRVLINSCTARAEKNAAHFQAIESQCFRKIPVAFKAFNNDFLILARTKEGLIKYLDKILMISAQHNLRLSATKCTVFKTKTKECRRIKDESKHWMDPRMFYVVRNIEFLENASKLCQFFHCFYWIATVKTIFLLKHKH